MLEITWLGHSSFQLKLDSGEVVVIDPWTEGPTYPQDYKFDRIDTILVTHGHFDHIHSVEPLAKQFKPTVVGIFEICTWLDSKGVENTSPMNKGGTQQVGPLSVTMTDAVHSCGILDDGNIIYGGEAAGFVVGLPDGRKFYFAGDTNVFTDMQLIHEIYRPELAFLPIGDLFTMSPREAAVACRFLKAKKVIPMHFGTFPPLTGTPEQLAERIKDLDTEVWPLEIGKPVQW
jgi:L-ascorbate metabolism protein UlaG (beta-lactamase superfamily)